MDSAGDFTNDENEAAPEGGLQTRHYAKVGQAPEGGLQTRHYARSAKHRKAGCKPAYARSARPQGGLQTRL